MPVFDIRCEKCDEVVEVSKAFHDSVPCPTCGHPHTKTLMPRVTGLPRETDPFHQKVGNTDKPIKSFGNDRRKGGKDTT